MNNFEKIATALTLVIPQGVQAQQIDAWSIDAATRTLVHEALKKANECGEGQIFAAGFNKNGKEVFMGCFVPGRSVKAVGGTDAIALSARIINANYSESCNISIIGATYGSEQEAIGIFNKLEQDLASTIVLRAFRSGLDKELTEDNLKKAGMSAISATFTCDGNETEINALYSPSMGYNIRVSYSNK